jgi:hypothetical protein
VFSYCTLLLWRFASSSVLCLLTPNTRTSSGSTSTSSFKSIRTRAIQGHASVHGRPTMDRSPTVYSSSSLDYLTHNPPIQLTHTHSTNTTTQSEQQVAFIDTFAAKRLNDPRAQQSIAETWERFNNFISLFVTFDKHQSQCISPEEAITLLTAVNLSSTLNSLTQIFERLRDEKDSKGSYPVNFPRVML